jgi:hypothetical protein
LICTGPVWRNVASRNSAKVRCRGLHPARNEIALNCQFSSQSRFTGRFGGPWA